MLRLLVRHPFTIRKSIGGFSKYLPNNKNIPLLNLTRTLKYAPIETNNKIEIGHKMTQVIEKHRQKHLQNKLENEKYSINFNQQSTRRLLIASSNPFFNHYTGQAYKNFSERNLASFGWRNRRSAGQYFTINAIRSHPSLIDSNKIRNEKGEMIEFEDLNINSNLINLVKQNLGMHQPTLIQYLSINQILQRETHNLIIAETGGGKTLTYALPIIECSIAIKKYLNESQLKRSLNQPICILIVPTRELAFQVYNTFNRLKNFEISQLATEEDKLYLNLLKNLNIVIDLHRAQIAAKEEISGEKLNSLNEVLFNPIDVLITLPGQLEDRLKNKYFNTAYLRQVVLDEADTLLDDSFSRTTLKCLSLLNLSLELPKVSPSLPEIKKIDDYQEELEENSRRRYELSLEFEKKLKDPSTQLLFVSATIPRDMKNILEDLIDCDNELKSINTNKTNRLMLHVPQKFIRTNGTKRPELLLEIVKKELDKKNTQRTMMVFTQKTKTAEYVHKYLKENNIESEILTKKLSNRQREQVVTKFFARQIRVLVCTDIASRGWDTIHVNHVINFEMPQFIADYLHRVGRVGRLNGHENGGGGGLVTNFIINRFEVDLVWNIEKSLRLGIELHNVNANIKRLYKYSYLNEKPVEEPREQIADKEIFNRKENEFSDEEDDNDDGIIETQNEIKSRSNQKLVEPTEAGTNEINDEKSSTKRSRRRRTSV
ncbi:unnamed protein product [Brachionus calyciflorus]|uniref:RNA helicase n=1 Tax=Brachionus calyciflorus TaxID=104777 RepID=A0A813M529_9BILA|nr:unnamed protein product [Brachionus calyciflorus]